MSGCDQACTVIMTREQGCDQHTHDHIPALIIVIITVPDFMFWDQNKQPSAAAACLCCAVLLFEGHYVITVHYSCFKLF